MSLLFLISIRLMNPCIREDRPNSVPLPYVGRVCAYGRIVLVTSRLHVIRSSGMRKSQKFTRADDDHNSFLMISV